LIISEILLLVDPWDLPRNHKFGLDETKVLSQLISTQSYLLKKNLEKTVSPNTNNQQETTTTSPSTTIIGIDVIEKLISVSSLCCSLSPFERPSFEEIVKELEEI